MTNPTWSIVEYRGRPGLEQLEADWKRLYAAMPRRSRYHAYEAQLAYLNHLCVAPTVSRYLALTDSRTVRAICPLDAIHDRSLGLPLRAWALPSHLHWIATDVIAPDDEARAALFPTVVDFLRRHPERRGLLVLGPTPESSNLRDGLHWMREGEYCEHLAMPSNFFDCEIPYDQLMGRLTKHFRRNLRSHGNKLQALGDVRFVNVSAQEELEAELEIFMAVEASGWKGQAGAGSAIRLHPNLVAFYRDLVRTMLGPEDRCEINSLYAEGRCVASQFCVRTGEEYTILKIAYDEAFARLGPGQLLFERTLERCCADPGISRLDLVSDASWFRDWHTQLMPMQQAHIAINRWSGRPLVSLLGFRYGSARRIVGRLRGPAGPRRLPRASRVTSVPPDTGQSDRT
jgi:Acetyltransferase (GNAT) domain